MFPIKDAEHFAEITSAENPRLNVIDVHLNWCGPCNIIEQNYRGLFFAYENADQRLAFWNCSEDSLPQEVMAQLKEGPLSCKPRFILFVEGEMKLEVNGADFTKIDAGIKKFIPSADE